MPPQPRKLVWGGDEDDLIKPSGRQKRQPEPGRRRPPPPIAFTSKAKGKPKLGFDPFSGKPPEDPFSGWPRKKARPRGWGIGAPSELAPALADPDGHPPTLFQDDPLPVFSGREPADPFEAGGTWGYEPPKRGISTGWWALVVVSALLLIASVGYAVQTFLELNATPASRFVDEVDGLPAEEVLRRAATLPEAVRGDAKVVAVVAEAKEALSADGRSRAEAVFVAIAGAETPDEREQVCDQALDAWADYVPALIERARARTARARVELAEGGGRRHPWSPARSDLTRALELEPENLDALLASAELALCEGDSQQAETNWRRATDAHPELPLGAFARGRLAEQQGRPEAARKGFRDALELDATCTPALLGLARLDLRKGHPEPALQILQPLLGEGGASEAIELAAWAWWQRDEPRRCWQALETALTRRPGSAQALGLKAFTTLPRDWRGRAVGEGEQQDRSRRIAEKALRVDPRNGWAHLTLALISSSRNALQHANRALEAGLGAEAHLVRGQLRLEGKDRSGTEDLRLVARSDDSSPRQRAVGHLLLAEMFLELGRREEAERHVDLAIKRVDLPQALVIRARIRVEAGNAREAESDLRRATKKAPRLVDAWFERAQVLRQLDVPSRALECLDQAEELIREGEPYGFARSMLSLERGRIYSDLDEHAAAIRYLDRFIAKASSQARDDAGVRAQVEEARRLRASCEARLTGGR